jgi:hypothetical protein
MHSLSLPTLFLTSLQLRRNWRRTLDCVQLDGEHAAIRYRKTSTMEIVGVGVHDTYRRALDDEQHPTPARTRGRRLLDTPADGWVTVPAKAALLALADVQAYVRDGLRVTVTRKGAPSVVCVPPSWALRAREALAASPLPNLA